jgi:hypothetical protein
MDLQFRLKIFRTIFNNRTVNRILIKIYTIILDKILVLNGTEKQ